MTKQGLAEGIYRDWLARDWPQIREAHGKNPARMRGVLKEYARDALLAAETFQSTCQEFKESKK